MQEFLRTNPNFLAGSSSSSLSVDSYSLGKPVLYSWKVSVANSLLGRFASIGMPPAFLVVELEQDLACSSNPSISNPKDGLALNISTLHSIKSLKKSSNLC